MYVIDLGCYNTRDCWQFKQNIYVVGCNQQFGANSTVSILSIIFFITCMRKGGWRFEIVEVSLTSQVPSRWELRVGMMVLLVVRIKVCSPRLRRFEESHAGKTEDWGC